MSASPLLLLLLLVPFFSSWLLALSAFTVTHLPGFGGALPFHLETGYVGVDEVNDVQLFYYFIESERNPEEDPVLLWITGGPGCSGFSALAFEIGPLKFEVAGYNGGLPTLVPYLYSWTKVSNIIFLDSPVGAGFSFARNSRGYEVGDITSSKQIYQFLRKWFIDHPKFLSNPLYIGGDSYAGMIVPAVTHEISEGIVACHRPLLNLKGYVLGNPVTGENIDSSARIPYAHGVGIISDELYEMTKKTCEADDYNHPSHAPCALYIQAVDKLFSEINMKHILEPNCPLDSPKPKVVVGDRRSLKEKYGELLIPPPLPALHCRSYAYYLSYYWANYYGTREALHIQKGTVDEWQRCSRDLPYTHDIPSSIKYHLSLTSKGYRALIYSGDHDLVIPFLGTQAWIRSLNFSIVDDWRSWLVGGQVAGYTKTYSNNVTFATIRGAGHTAPEYKPEESLAMFQQWISHKPL